MNDPNFEALGKQFSILRAGRIKCALVTKNMWASLDVNGDGLAILCSNARIKLMNSAFETMTGIPKFEQDNELGPLSLNSENQTAFLSDNTERSTLRPSSDFVLDLMSILTGGFLNLNISLVQIAADEVLCILRPLGENARNNTLRDDLDYAQAIRHSFTNFLAVISALSDTLPEEGGLNDSTSLGVKRMNQAVAKAIADMNAIDECQSLNLG